MFKKKKKLSQLLLLRIVQLGFGDLNVEYGPAAF